MQRRPLEIKVLNAILSYPRLEVELDRDCAMALVARQRVVLKSVDHHAAWTEEELQKCLFFMFIKLYHWWVDCPCVPHAPFYKSDTGGMGRGCFSTSAPDSP